MRREDLQARLWGRQEFGNFDRGINKVISRLREALGDDADHPSFIETLPRRGYRFIAPLERAQEPEPKSHSAPMNSVRAQVVPSHRIAAIVAAVLAIGLLALAMDKGGISGLFSAREIASIKVPSCSKHFGLSSAALFL